MRKLALMAFFVAIGVPALGVSSPAVADELRYVDLGPDWTDERRLLFYDIDQGSQLIPLAWLKALRQADGKPFLDGALARYGYIPRAVRSDDDLPIGFTKMPAPQGVMVGISCAACHVRDMTVKGVTYRIDGGPTNVDFAPFAADLDAAMSRIRQDDASFDVFAQAVLGDRYKAALAQETLRAEIDLWWVRYHTFIARSLPKHRLWGPARMDAISLIYNRLSGLDVGAPPTYLIPSNIEVGHAPVRYPFLWNSPRQDITQWTGFAANGNDFYALTRNLGEEYGVFGTFHPQKTTATFAILDRNYLIDNSANMKGLMMAETLLRSMTPPKWPWAVDRDLARRGEAIFNRATEAGGCVACHGIKLGKPPNDAPQATFETPVIDVGTDRRAWVVALRKVDTGRMEGASIQGLVPPLKKRDDALALLRAAVVGAIAMDEQGAPAAEKQAGEADDPKARIHQLAEDRLGFSLVKAQAAIKQQLGLGPPPPPPLVVNGYEARVLQGIWAAAPYLHNGSVPSLTELLKPPAARIKSFKLGAEYDPATLGLAAEQPRFDFTLKTTGCDDLLSGDSNCGHDYGTRLAPDDKRALLEFLKTF